MKFKSTQEAYEKGLCAFCHKKVDLKNFRDEESRREYPVSALCQNCQDVIWGKGEWAL